MSVLQDLYQQASKERTAARQALYEIAHEVWKIERQFNTGSGNLNAVVRILKEAGFDITDFDNGGEDGETFWTTETVEKYGRSK